MTDGWLRSCTSFLYSPPLYQLSYREYWHYGISFRPVKQPKIKNTQLYLKLKLKGGQYTNTASIYDHVLATPCDWLTMTRDKRSTVLRQKDWTPRRGIEPRSPAWQAGILATILSRIYVKRVNVARLELTTFGSGIRCSTNWATHPCGQVGR